MDDTISLVSLITLIGVVIHLSVVIAAAVWFVTQMRVSIAELRSSVKGLSKAIAQMEQRMTRLEDKRYD